MAERVATSAELEAALRRAMSHRRPHLLELLTPYEECSASDASRPIIQRDDRRWITARQKDRRMSTLKIEGARFMVTVDPERRIIPGRGHAHRRPTHHACGENR